ncbi:hypothetical protein ES707_03935 [subsurface metagenome]
MAAAIVELDALADAVRPAAEDDDLLAIRRRAFISRVAGERRLIGRIHVGRGGGEFRRAGIDPLEHRADRQLMAFRGDFRFRQTCENRKPGIRKAHGFQRAHAEGVWRQAVAANLGFHVDDAAHLRQEPGIDLARGEYLLVGPAEPHRLRHLQQSVRCWRAQGGADRVLVVTAAEPFDLDLVEAGEAGLQSAQRFLQALLEGTADRHDFADRLHRRRQRVRGPREFLEGKARNLGDDVVDGGLERGRRGTARDVVGDLVQRVADRELGGDLGDRKAGGLRRQSGRARHARVHLDHDHAAVSRVEAELHVGAAGLHADLAQHRQRGVAHDLIFLIGQGQGRRNGDGIAGVHAHRIEVLDRADDDAVVLFVADDLHLVLFPAEHGFLDQHLIGRRGIQTALDDI